MLFCTNFPLGVYIWSEEQIDQQTNRPTVYPLLKMKKKLTNKINPISSLMPRDVVYFLPIIVGPLDRNDAPIVLCPSKRPYACNRATLIEICIRLYGNLWPVAFVRSYLHALVFRSKSRCRYCLPDNMTNLQDALISPRGRIGRSSRNKLKKFKVIIWKERTCWSFYKSVN